MIIAIYVGVILTAALVAYVGSICGDLSASASGGIGKLFRVFGPVLGLIVGGVVGLVIGIAFGVVGIKFVLAHAIFGVVMGVITTEVARYKH